RAAIDVRGIEFHEVEEQRAQFLRKGSGSVGDRREKFGEAPLQDAFAAVVAHGFEDGLSSAGGMGFDRELEQVLQLVVEEVARRKGGISTAGSLPTRIRESPRGLLSGPSPRGWTA